MQMTRRVALNGVWLDNVDSRIVISSIEPGDGKENIAATDSAARYGQRVTQNRRSTLDVVVKFMMLEHGHSVNGLQARAELLEKVNEWASAGGVMTINYKPGRRLNVILVQAPGEGSLWNYTKEFSIVFRAYAVPYWEDTEDMKVMIQNTSSYTVSVGVSGSAPTPILVAFKNTSGSTSDTFSVSAGGKTISFSSLGLASGETLTINEGTNGLFQAYITSTGGVNRSAMSKRTAESADDLVVNPGTVSVSVTSQRVGTLTVSHRGRYL